MVKTAVLTLVLGMGVAFPASGVLHPKPNPAQVEQHLLREMNSGPSGKITKSVACLPASSTARWTCHLRSTRSTSVGARVIVSGGAVETVWQPISG
jgi:hypothetical protein